MGLLKKYHPCANPTACAIDYENGRGRIKPPIVQLQQTAVLFFNSPLYFLYLSLATSRHFYSDKVFFVELWWLIIAIVPFDFNVYFHCGILSVCGKRRAGEIRLGFKFIRRRQTPNCCARNGLPRTLVIIIKQSSGSLAVYIS